MYFLTSQAFDADKSLHLTNSPDCARKRAQREPIRASSLGCRDECLICPVWTGNYGLWVIDRFDARHVGTGRCRLDGSIRDRFGRPTICPRL